VLQLASWFRPHADPETELIRADSVLTEVINRSYIEYARANNEAYIYVLRFWEGRNEVGCCLIRRSDASGVAK
jgi:hypothetical protein